jgi:tetratricopeptide (TPR) repeat protein
VALGAWGWNWKQTSQSAPVVARIEAGQKYLQAGKGEAAEAEWQQAVKLAPDNVEVWQLLGDYYIRVQNWKAARAALGHVQQLQPDAPNLNGNLAVCAMGLGDTKKVEQYAEAELKRNPDDAAVMEVLVDALAQRRELEKRTKYARRLAQLRPDNPDALLKLALALDDQQMYQEALPLLSKLVQLAPGYAPGYALRGKALVNLNTSEADVKRAEGDLLKALSLDSKDVDSHWWLGKLYLSRKEAAKAIPHFKAVGAMNPAATDHLFELARAYQQQGNSVQAADLRRRYGRMEQINERITMLKSRLANQPDNFENNLQAGLLLLQSNNPLHVERYLKKAQSLRPNDPRAKTALQLLEAQYGKELQSGLKALKQQDYAKVGPAMNRILLLRPRDPRTIAAVRQATATLVGSTQPGSRGSTAGTAAASPPAASGSSSTTGGLRR